MCLLFELLNNYIRKLFTNLLYTVYTWDKQMLFGSIDSVCLSV